MQAIERGEETVQASEVNDEGKATVTVLQEGRKPLIPELTPHAELALLARVLHREGYDDHISGHMTLALGDGTLLTNPWELAWDEICASDVMRIDLEGAVLEGVWSITPAIELHLALHRMRPDIIVSVHNHPYWSMVWANLKRVPPIYDQTCAYARDDVVVHDDYAGIVDDVDAAESAARALSSASASLLGHHGVFVVAPSIRHAYLRCMQLERRSRHAWFVEAVGDAEPMDEKIAAFIAGRTDGTDLAIPYLWEAMVRRELRHDPAILD